MIRSFAPIESDWGETSFRLLETGIFFYKHLNLYGEN